MDLIERLRSVKWEVLDDAERMRSDPAHECVFVDMRPADFRALLREAAAALEAARKAAARVVRGNPGGRGASMSVSDERLAEITAHYGPLCRKRGPNSRNKPSVRRDTYEALRELASLREAEREFRRQWELDHGPGSWDAVWAVSFRRAET